MVLHVHRGTATDELADALGGLLREPLDDPFAQEVVAVPARGVERWLAQRLSHRLGARAGWSDGVAAGIRFLSPHSLVSLILGVDRDDPWQPDRLAWAVLAAVDEAIDQPWAGVLAAHLGHDRALSHEERELRHGRRFAVARRLAGLFSAYAQQRPAMLQQWRDDAGLPGAEGDGIGGVLDPDLAWQPRLWRMVLDRVDAPPPDVRHARVVAELAAGAPPGSGLELPGRLSLFGHTRIARSEVEIVRALARLRDVHLWLPQASPTAWRRLAPELAVGPVPRAQDHSAVHVRHPLLASLGRDARELQRTLALAADALACDGAAGDEPAGDDPAADALATPASADREMTDEVVAESATQQPADAAATAPATLLEWLQRDIRADAPPSRDERQARVVRPDDRSIQVHACHGRGRQVDVVRDVLAGLLQDDPTLEPRDILVMCPDIDSYAALIHAGFGLGSVVRDEAFGEGDAGAAPRAHPAHGLRVSLADRAPAHTNELLALAARLVTLAGGRVTAGEVLDIARSPAVRRRFGLDEDGLDDIARWVDDAGVRWGLDEPHRREFGLHNIAQNTWQSGIERIMLGAAVDGQQTTSLGTTLALDALDSGDVDLAGRLAELLDRLARTLRRLGECHRPQEWTAALRDGVLGLADPARADAWQVAHLTRELARIEGAAASQAGVAAEVAGGAAVGVAAVAAGARGRGPREPSLRLSDVGALLEGHLQGRATRSNFRTGTLTVCTMVPMRSVPHRVVCLVGLDDGVFPRTTTPDGDDALARRPVTGERDPRAEDRQLLLDAVMAARQTLVITYTGADEHTGTERPPAVPLRELVDAVRDTAGAGLQRLVTRHPLQPYDLRNLGADEVGTLPLRADGAPFSHDPVALAGGTALLGPLDELAARRSMRDGPEPARTAPRLLAGPLSPSARDDVEWSDLLRFLTNPVGVFLRDRLGILLPEEPEERVEGIPLELDGLGKWQVGSRLLEGLLHGHDPEALGRAERWRGELPPHRLGERVLTGESTQAQAMAEYVRSTLRLPDGAAMRLDSRDVDLALPSGRRIVGTIGGIVPSTPNTSTLEVSYSSLGPKHRIGGWLRALTLAGTGEPMTSSHVIAHVRRRQRGQSVKVPVRCFFSAPEQAEALALLDQLLDLRDHGLCEPLPLAPRTSAAWAREFGYSDVRGADEKARSEWETDDFGRGIPGEQDSPAHQFAFGERLPFAALLTEPAEDERWAPGVPHRLGQYALRLWGPMSRFEGQS